MILYLPVDHTPRQSREGLPGGKDCASVPYTMTNEPPRAGPRGRRGLALAVAVLASALALPDLAGAIPPGPLTVGQLQGRDGCLSLSGSRGLCERTRGLVAGSLNGPSSVAVSPDSRHVYVAASGASAVLVLRRDPLTGALREAGCVGEGSCTPARGLELASALALSPDGRNLYVISPRGTVASFARDGGSGALTQVGCIGQGESTPGCEAEPALRGASDAAVSPDGRNLYVASRFSSAVVTFARGEGGDLRRVDCLAASSIEGCRRARALEGARTLGVSPAGDAVYVTSTDTVSLLERDSATGTLQPRSCVSAAGVGGCARLRHLDGASSAAPSPDGRHVYVTAGISNSVTTFRVSGKRLVAAGCLVDDGDGGCRRGFALDGAADAVVSPDGRTVYVASGRYSDGLTALRRDPRSGRLDELGCLTSNRAGGACAKGISVGGAAAAALSPDGRSLYVLGTRSDSLAVLGPEVGIAGRRWPVGRNGVVKLRLVCPRNARGRCRGLMRLRTVGALRVGRGRARRVTVGSARFSLAAGRRRVLRVRMSSRFVSPVRRARGLRVRPLVFSRR